MSGYCLPKIISTSSVNVVQELIVGLIFVVALGYLGKRIYRNFAKKQVGCGKGCGCDADTRSTTLTATKR